jgi:hypothetical protein
VKHGDNLDQTLERRTSILRLSKRPGPIIDRSAVATPRATCRSRWQLSLPERAGAHACSLQRKKYNRVINENPKIQCFCCASQCRFAELVRTRRKGGNGQQVRSCSSRNCPNPFSIPLGPLNKSASCPARGRNWPAMPPFTTSCRARQPTSARTPC